MTYDLINILIPSFKRVKMLDTCIQSALDTAKHICFTICVNEADKETLQYINNSPLSNIYAILENTVKPNLSLYYNKMYALTPWKNAIVSMIGDDMVFQTNNWDLKILEDFNTHSGELVLYCNDGYHVRDKMCVNLFTTRKVVAAQKNPFMCERYHADMIDFIWFLTGKYTSILKYRDDIIIEHRHSREKPEEQWDDTFKRLAPLQASLKTDDELKYAIMYASICAGNLIMDGIGENPVKTGNPLFLKNTEFVRGNGRP